MKQTNQTRGDEHSVKAFNLEFDHKFCKQEQSDGHVGIPDQKCVLKIKGKNY